MRRRLTIGAIVLALCAGLIGGLAPTPTVSTSAPVVEELGTTGAEAGIGYWSRGCRLDEWWHQNASEVDWFVRFSRNPPYGAIYVIQHALRRVYRSQGNECGALGRLTSDEQFNYWQHPWRGARWGWIQYTENGRIFWDQYDCTGSYYYVNSSRVLVGGQCGNA